MKPRSPRPSSTGNPRASSGGRRPAGPQGRKPPAKKTPAGRPPKYATPSRPITVTLPEETLKTLEHIHPDRGQAIVKLADAAMRRAESDPPLVEIVEMADNTGLLLVGPSRTLRRIPFLHLIEVAPARFLLALDPGNDFQHLEIALRDAMEEPAPGDDREREMLQQLLSHIRNVRKTERVSMAEVLFVRLREKVGRKMPSLMPAAFWLLSSAGQQPV